jgi:mRNA interferase MazF
VKRGDFVTVAMAGDYGKPRPALVIQSDLFAKHASVTVLLVTGTLVNAPLLRVPVQPDDRNGLLKKSQIMVDKAMTVARDRLGPPFGEADDALMIEVSRRLAVFLGLAG